MAVSQTAQTEMFSDALTGGKPTIDVRIRYEGVTQDGKKDASALLSLKEHTSDIKQEIIKA